MLFNSVTFFGFFFVVYVAYRFSNHAWQNRLLLVASYFFYGAWDWRFVSLLMISTLVDYTCGLKIHDAPTRGRARQWLTMSVVLNLSFLGFFKYFNFFSENLLALFHLFGINADPVTIGILAPVGISFYTFQSMSYLIDVYRGDMQPTRNLLDYALYVAFFPQLVAGPIVRAQDLLPQVEKPRSPTREQIYAGAYLVGWGLFEKVAVADNLAKLVDPVFAAPPHDPALVLVASYAFYFQIFCDFAGYSDIARGLAKLMGFELMVNFRAPMFSYSVADIWRRWHVSLSSWVRDYIYRPLSQSLTWAPRAARQYLALFIAMELMGLWHGAAWHFVVFGAVQGVSLVAERAWAQWRGTSGSPRPRGVWGVLRVIFAFHYTVLSLAIFRVADMPALAALGRGLTSGSVDASAVVAVLVKLVPLALIVLFVQWGQFRTGDQTWPMRLPVKARAVFYALCFYLVVYFGDAGGRSFIYFQF